VSSLIPDGDWNPAWVGTFASMDGTRTNRDPFELDEPSADMLEQRQEVVWTGDDEPTGQDDEPPLDADPDDVAGQRLAVAVEDDETL
jgi:hypothetical protein